MASHAPKGAPITSAIRLADRLTRNDKTTMPSSSASRRPISDNAAATDRVKSFIQPASGACAASFPVRLGAEGTRRRMGMRMRVRMRLDRHHHDMAVTNTALGDDMVGKRLHLAAAPLQNRDLEAGIMVDVNVQRRLREVVVLMILVGQALRQFARGVIVDIAQRRDTVAIARGRPSRVLDAATQQIAKGLRAVGITVLRDEIVD